jgi:transposase
MESYSATKKNDILSFADKWIELENIILSEVRQVQKAQNLMFSLTCRIDLIQMQKYYETLITLSGGQTRER